MKKLMIAAAMAAALPAAAHAVPLNDTFTIDIYNYNAGGSANAASATVANVDANALNFVDRITYTGALNFGLVNPVNTILAFLQTGGGMISGVDADLNRTLSTGQGTGGGKFQITTLFDITASFGSGFFGTIRHDDGITVLDDGEEIAASAAPTTAINTAYDFSGGAFRLIYAAANGNPSVLQVDATPALVPLPAPALLLLSALAGLGFVSRRGMRA